MLRVVPSGNAAAAQRYHAAALKREDYYSQGQEIAGQWHGRAAELLGLSGDVTTQQFAALTECRDPISGKQLTPRMNADRIAGYDLNFHAPKSLSVLQALTGDQDLVSAFREAVAETMVDIEKLAMTRVRLGGAQDDRVTSNLVWADYVHFTARPVDGLPDPHLHVHCFVMNLTFDHIEERWKAAKFHDIKSEAPQFEAAFHARLAKKVSDLGYVVRRTRNRWEIAGIPETVLKKNSRRSIEIEKLAEELGITDSKKKDELGAKTRKGKRKGIAHDELLNEWQSRLTEEERLSVDRCYRKREMLPREKVTAEEALEFAEEKCFERDSVVRRSKLVAAALRYGVGHVLPSDIERAIAERGIIERAFDGDVLCTTPEIMMEEARLIQRVRDGRGKLAPLVPARISFGREFLSKEQREAVRHVLQSNDQVIAIRGVAGAGKTTALEEIREQLQAAGIRTFAFAQSANASRGVLRESGFSDADTIARLLVDKDLQMRVRGSVIVIDESGIVGIRDLTKIMEIAGERTRVILVGDTAQHAPVARGDAMRLLENYSGIPVAAIRQIRRQEKIGYREAIKALSEGDTVSGFAMLEHLGAVIEITADKLRYQTLAEEYFRCIDLTGKAPLVVSPTHYEGRAVTDAIREQLAERGLLGKGRSYIQYRDLKWEGAEKRLVENYSEGLMVQFHQNARGIKRGSILPVAAVDLEDKVVFLQGPKGERIQLDWKQVDRFQVFEKAEIHVAEGDVIKITRGSTDVKGKRLNNGSLLKVKKIGPDGRIEMENGVILPPDHGHLAHGYCDTSHASQGKTVDEVFVAQSAASFLAASKEGFYVSCSRGKQNIRIFTDDKLELLRAVGKSSKRLSALEFGGVGREVFMTPGLDGTEWVKRIAQEKARLHEPASHVEKLLTARRMDPNKRGEVLSFEAYIKMRRGNIEPDGKSRSLGTGPSKPKKPGKVINDPRGGLRARPAKSAEVKPSKTPEEKKPERKTRIGKKVETVKKRLTSSLKKSLPEKSVSQDPKRKVGIGNLKVKVSAFGGKVAAKVQERREKRKERQLATPKKAPEAKQQKKETKIQPPPTKGRK